MTDPIIADTVLCKAAAEAFMKACQRPTMAETYRNTAHAYGFVNKAVKALRVEAVQTRHRNVALEAK